MDSVIATLDRMMLDRGQGKVLDSKSTRLSFMQRRYASTTVFVVRSRKMKVTTVRSMIEGLPAGHRAVFVGAGVPTSFSKKEIKASMSQYFMTKELLFPVTDHPLVPLHKKVAAPPSGMAKQDLPGIEETDPVCRYYWLKPGDVVEIDRGGYKYYRVVVTSSYSD